MQANPQFWGSKRVCVTGGTGFLGWHLVRQLLPLAAHVRILGLAPRSKALRERIKDLDCVYGDVRDPVAARHALGDCDVVFHTAGAVGVWGPALIQMRDIHLEGTRQIVRALPDDARLVHTSSVVAIGASRCGQVLSETASFDLHRLKVDYVHAKRGAEEIALAAAADGRDVVVVNPAYLIGPDDHEGSVMGRLCLRCWKGKVPLVPPGGLNFVDVRDVALGHLLAAERGAIGRRYILGGENLTMVEFAHALASARGMAPRRVFPMPTWVYFLIACGAEVRAHFCRGEPYPSMQHVRMNRYCWYYSSDRAHTELGFKPRSVRKSLEETHEWYCGRGQLKPLDRAVSDGRNNRRNRAA